MRAFAKLYFGLQAAAVPLWWACILLVPEWQKPFFPPALPREVLLAFMTPDVLVLGAGSLVAAIGVAKGAWWAREAAWACAGAGLYAGIFTFLLCMQFGAGWYGMLSMVAPTVVPTVIALRLPRP